MPTKRDKSTRRPARRKLVRLTSNLTIQDLQNLEVKEPRGAARPKALKLKDIKVADKVFQRRLPREDIIRDEKHVWDLVDAIDTVRETGEQLEPILVTPIGDNFFVVDGHHRLDAYATAKFTGWIPVELFEGSVAQARMEALERNVKTKLPMSDDARAQAAWEMVVEEEKRLKGARPPYGSRAAIIKHTRVKTRTIARMRAFARKYGDAVWDRMWREVARLQWAADLDFAKGDDYKDRRARLADERANRLAKHFLKGPSLVRDFEVTARALEIVSSDLPLALAREWFHLALDAWLDDAEEDLPYGKEGEVWKAIQLVRRASLEL